ncbi:MAG: DUF1611 domain-containing protein [Gemmatimonadota bacterium]
MELSRAVYVILAENLFGVHSSKTAASAIRYFPERVAAVIDSRYAGRCVQDVLGFGGQIPIVSGLEQALARGEPPPTALLVGVSPRGGQLPPGWTDVIVRAAEHGLDLVSGLHQFLADIPAISAAAQRVGVEICDLRRAPTDLSIAMGRAREVDAFTVLTVGTDCNLGKMTTALEIRAGLVQRGERVAFAATGQTGILIEGWGISVDAVIGDFVAGASERLVLQAAELTGSGGIILVEGQGSLLHPAYSGVTLGLLHGSMPNALLLCHDVARSCIRSDGEYDFVPLPPLKDMVTLVEAAAAWLRPAPVIGISLKTNTLAEDEARELVQRVEEETGLPVTDPIRFGVAPLVDAVRNAAISSRISGGTITRPPGEAARVHAG